MRIGVIIPAWNEEAVLSRTLRAVHAGGRAALIVVADYGSTDRTAVIARRHGAIVAGRIAPSGRAAALNAGARRALREDPALDVLWFVHADALPPVGWDVAIAEALCDERIVVGAFDFRWDLTGVEWLDRMQLAALGAANRVRFRLTGIYYGDQGIFVRRGSYEAAGGFPELPLMEDATFMRRVRLLGRRRLARGFMTVNPRRFLRHGVARQTIVDVLLLAGHQLGWRPTRLQEWYNREKG